MNFRLTQYETEGMPTLLGKAWQENLHPRGESGRFGDSDGKKPSEKPQSSGDYVNTFKEAGNFEKTYNRIDEQISAAQEKEYSATSKEKEQTWREQGKTLKNERRKMEERLKSDRDLQISIRLSDQGQYMDFGKNESALDDLKNMLDPSKPRNTKDLFSGFVTAWTNGSDDPASVFLKSHVSKALGVKGFDYHLKGDNRKQVERVNKYIEGTRFEQELHNYIKDTYNETQKNLLKEVKLFRGVYKKYNVGSTLESWSSSYEAANDYNGGGVIEKKVQRKDTFLPTNRTSYGHHEKEYVVINGGRK